MKNNRGKKEVALVASGIVFGATLAAPVAGAALTAQQSNQKITVDGKPVQIEAYSIGGSNYCKLRDVGKAVGFAVEYDPITNTVCIRTDQPYSEEAPARSSRVVSLPTDGSQYVPQLGDVILCDDGTEYEIKNVVRWDTASSKRQASSRRACTRSATPSPRRSSTASSSPTARSSP